MRARAGTVTAALLVLAGCFHPLVGPARTDRSYELKASSTAQKVDSEVNTAKLAAKAAGDGDAFAAYLSVVVGEAESGASGTHNDFDAVQPPSVRAQHLRARLDALLQDVDDALGRMRIAIRRGHVDSLPELAKDLPRLDRRLQAFHDEHT
jgi:hypothetical protein